MRCLSSRRRSKRLSRKSAGCSVLILPSSVGDFCNGSIHAGRGLVGPGVWRETGGPSYARNARWRLGPDSAGRPAWDQDCGSYSVYVYMQCSMPHKPALITANPASTMSSGSIVVLDPESLLISHSESQFVEASMGRMFWRSLLPNCSSFTSCLMLSSILLLENPRSRHRRV